jgi:hypothetical protein
LAQNIVGSSEHAASLFNYKRYVISDLDDKFIRSSETPRLERSLRTKTPPPRRFEIGPVPADDEG